MPFEPLPSGYLLDNRYRIEKVIGEGGMGRVYLARDTRLSNRAVAVKEMIVGDATHEKKAVEDFNRERDLLARLSHPGIPSIIDYIVVGHRHYLVMEFIAGGDLQSRLEKLGPNGRFPEAQVLRWARQLLDILRFLHSQKPPIIYRDLKPANIMVDENGRAMLIDFGIARFLPPTGRGTQIGSVGYAPPEQYLGNVEPRSDLYALAATMHHLLTGRDPQLEPPFSFPPVRQLAPEVSEQTERVIMQALEQDISKRPASAEAMLAALPDPDAHLTIVSPSAQGKRTGAAAPSGATISSPAKPQTPKVRTPGALPSAQASAERTRNISSQPLSRGPVAVSPTAKTEELPPLDKVSHTAPSHGAVSARSVSAHAQQNRAPQIKAPATSSQVRSLPSGAGRGAIAERPTPSPPAAKASDKCPRLVAEHEPVELILNGSRVVIGRKTSAFDNVDIDLSHLSTQKSELVSRHHAEIIKQADGYYIRDLGSTNGTYIVGKGRLGRDQLYRLRDRDKIAFANVILEFRES